jgi:hypothetical protein
MSYVTHAGKAWPGTQVDPCLLSGGNSGGERRREKAQTTFQNLCNRLLLLLLFMTKPKQIGEKNFEEMFYILTYVPSQTLTH